MMVSKLSRLGSFFMCPYLQCNQFWGRWVQCNPFLAPGRPIYWRAGRVCVCMSATQSIFGTRLAHKVAGGMAVCVDGCNAIHFRRRTACWGGLTTDLGKHSTGLM